MALSKKIKEYLDSLDDELFLAEIAIRFGHDEPIWEECSRSEYEENCGPIVDQTTIWTKEIFEEVIKNLVSSQNYKAEPIFKNQRGGILWQMECHKPDGYKFYKQVGKEFVICLGSDMVDYCAKRECMKPYFENDFIQRKIRREELTK